MDNGYLPESVMTSTIMKMKTITDMKLNHIDNCSSQKQRKKNLFIITYFIITYIFNTV